MGQGGKGEIGEGKGDRTGRGGSRKRGRILLYQYTIVVEPLKRPPKKGVVVVGYLRMTECFSTR